MSIEFKTFARYLTNYSILLIYCILMFHYVILHYCSFEHHKCRVPNLLVHHVP